MDHPHSSAYSPPGQAPPGRRPLTHPDDLQVTDAFAELLDSRRRRDFPAATRAMRRLWKLGWLVRPGGRFADPRESASPQPPGRHPADAAALGSFRLVVSAVRAGQVGDAKPHMRRLVESGWVITPRASWGEGAAH